MADTDPPPIHVVFFDQTDDGTVSIEHLEFEDKVQYSAGLVILFPRNAPALSVGDIAFLNDWADLMAQLLQAYDEPYKNGDGTEDPEMGWRVGVFGVWPKHLLSFFLQSGDHLRQISTPVHWFQRMDPVLRELHVRVLAKPNANLTLVSDALNGWRHAHLRPV
jgi:hypothetical protein